MNQEWTVTAPPDVAWTSDEFRQIGEALRALQSRLPGRYPRVTLDRILVVPRDEPGEAVEPDVTAQLIAGCSCGGPGCPPIPCPSFEDVTLEITATCSCVGNLRPGDVFAPGCPIHDPGVVES